MPSSCKKGEEFFPKHLRLDEQVKARFDEIAAGKASLETVSKGCSAPSNSSHALSGEDYLFRRYHDLFEEMDEAFSKTPPHYSNNQPLSLMNAIGDLPSFARGSAIKYLARAGKKGSAKADLFKAVHYCLMLIRLLDSQAKATSPSSEETKA